MDHVDPAIIAQLLQPYAVLAEEQVRNTSTYIDLLLKWNSKINLTAVRRPEEIVTRHFGESFFAATQLLTREWQGTVIDLGSGAGFPGLPLAMYARNASVTLIESNGKKAAFLNEVIFALALKNVRVFAQRAETYHESADLVTMRAVEQFEKALPVAAGLVRIGGRLALMIGAKQVESAKLLPGIDWQHPIVILGADSSVLLVGSRVA